MTQRSWHPRRPFCSQQRSWQVTVRLAARRASIPGQHSGMNEARRGAGRPTLFGDMQRAAGFARFCRPGGLQYDESMRALLALLSIATAGATCKCDARFSPCREASSANVVFIGTVESVTPAFLDSWNESQKESLALLNREFAGVQGDRSTAAFARLRDAYLKVFPDLPPEHKK